MSDAEKVVIGIILTALIGLIVWQLQSNFNDLKAGIKDIRDNMVGKTLCGERHRAIEEKLLAHSASIRHLYQRTDGEAILREIEEREKEG
jgi:hypothetical protein